MTSLVRFNNVTKVFGSDTLAVDNISLSIAEGEFVTLLGPSGCGKTTLLRMLAGFEAPTSGTIELAGEDVTELPPYKRNVNMVFQDYALFPHLTVQKNIAFGLERLRLERSEINQKVAAMLSLVDLTDKADNKPYELSGGQRQRVALARAIVREPRVLLLDEPLSSLDANLREAMQVELKHLHRQLGLTFVLVTHDQTEALVMSDRTVVMNNGSIVQVGTPSELYDQPATTYVADFIGTSNLLNGTVAEVGASSVGVAVGDVNFQCAARNSLVTGQQVIVGFRPEKVQLLTPEEKAGAGWNVFESRVTEVLFHGSRARLRCNLPGGASIICDLQLGTSAAKFGIPEPGSTVKLAMDPDNVPIFTEDDRI
jgi:putative spermidine/putrescine transport system ATP-binding protein/spermidine/putrescine transport system ATP-binding protein